MAFALAIGTSVLINMGRARYAWCTLVPLAFMCVNTLTAGWLNLSVNYLRPQLAAGAPTLWTAFLAAPTPIAREMLLELPGVGPKTADVWLSLVAGRDTMPMDTHIARLVRRWHLSAATDYGGVNEDLRRNVPPPDRRAGHLALIYFGREICQARRPQCEACPVYDECDAGEKRPRGRDSKG